MQKFLLATLLLVLLAASSVHSQKGRSFVNANRSPARKVQGTKSSLARPSQPLGGGRQLAPNRVRARPQAAAASPVRPAPIAPIVPVAPIAVKAPLAPQLPDRSSVAAPTLVRPRPVAAVAAPVRNQEGPHPAPEPYSFSFAVDDEETGARLKREESQDINGNIVGFYHILDAEGRRRRVDYTAGPEGFKAIISSNEEGLMNRNAADADFVVEEAPVERQNAAAAAARARASRSANARLRH